MTAGRRKGRVRLRTMKLMEEAGFAQDDAEGWYNGTL
jgi:hypothetical protein